MIEVLNDKIKTYTDRLNTIKENVSNEIDSMSDEQKDSAIKEMERTAEFVRELKDIKNHLKGQAIFWALKPGTLPTIDAFEVSPVAIADVFEKDGKKQFSLETCDEGSPDTEMYSVYIHHKGGGVDCIADCTGKEEAEGLVTFLKELISVYKPLAD